MKHTHRFKKFCTEFVVLDDVEKDYTLGISEALAFAVKKPKCTCDSAISAYIAEKAGEQKEQARRDWGK